MEENNIFQLNWDKFFKNGKTVILPIDHGTVIPVPELNDTGQLIEDVSPFVDGFVVNYGTARTFSDQLTGKGFASGQMFTNLCTNQIKTMEVIERLQPMML